MNRILYLVLMCLMALNVEAQGLRLPTKRPHSANVFVRPAMKKPTPQRKIVVSKPRTAKPRPSQARPSKPVYSYGEYDNYPTAEKKVTHKKVKYGKSYYEELDEEEQSETQLDEDNSNKIYTVAEVMPSFRGHVNAWLCEHLQYPAVAAENGIQGRVIVKFVVDSDGNVSQAQVVRGVAPSLDREALRVVNSMPTWNPGMNHGKPANVWFTLPITFKIQ